MHTSPCCYSCDARDRPHPQVYIARKDLEPALYATTSSLRMGANATTEQTLAVTAILDEVPHVPNALFTLLCHPLHRTIL